MKNLALLFLSVLLLSCTQEPKNSISLGVEQTVQIPVEYVSVSASLQLEDTDPAKVEKEGYDKLANTVNLLTEIGYENEQLEINSGEVRNMSYRDSESFRYTSFILFDIYDLDQIDTIRRALIKEGINNFNITGYKNTKEDSLYDLAYQQAIDQARKQAQKLVQNEDVRIGEIMNLSENIQESAYIVSAMQMNDEVINLDAELSMDPVNPLFNKEYYNKTIEFKVEFALE